MRRDYPALALAPDADGKLPYTEGTRLGYRGIIAAGKTARHPLGSGLGYARFEWSDAQAEGDGVAVTVANVSDRAGTETVQVYRDKPETTLVGFTTIKLAPGESGRVKIALPRRRFMEWSDGWEPIAASVPVRIARHAEDAGTTLDIDTSQLQETGL